MTYEDLEKICFALLGTTQDVKWGNDLCYLVGKKMYCVTPLDPPLKVSFKVTPEEFEMLTDRKGIIPAPYAARNNWVLVESANALTLKEWKQYVAQSYELVLAGLSKKTQALIRDSGQQKVASGRVKKKRKR